MGAIKIQITELTIPNDFKVYYKAGTDVTGLSFGINPYPMGSDDPIADGFTDYGQIFLGVTGTTTVDLIGDFIYGQVYWIIVQELNHRERWMVKNIKINAPVIYQSFLNITPTPTPSISPTPSFTRTPIVSSTPTKTPTRSVTPTISKSPILSPSLTPSHTPSPTRTPSRTPTPSITPSRHGQTVTIINMNASYAIIAVSVNGVPVTDAIYPVTGGMEAWGSTLQLGLSELIEIWLSNTSNGEHINIVGNVCTSTISQDYMAFPLVDTTGGVIIQYGAGLC